MENQNLARNDQRKTLDFAIYNGAQGQNRTADTWIFNPILTLPFQWVSCAFGGKIPTEIQWLIIFLEKLLFSPCSMLLNGPLGRSPFTLQPTGRDHERQDQILCRSGVDGSAVARADGQGCCTGRPAAAMPMRAYGLRGRYAVGRIREPVGSGEVLLQSMLAAGHTNPLDSDGGPMSTHPFKPVQALGSDSRISATVDDVFTSKELDEIVRLGDALVQIDDNASLGRPDYHRLCKLAGIKKSADTEWLYDRLAQVAADLNAQFFQFDVFGFVEHFQYAVYEEGGHFAWHIDKHPSIKSPRKLSLTLQLSDEADYEGGVLEFRTDMTPRQASMKRGSVNIFPSWLSHRVTPVTKGIRKSLVVWIAGPNFK